MTFAGRCAAMAGLFTAWAALASADQAAVVYKDGLLTVRCADSPLSQVLEQIKAVTGMALIVEGSAGATRLTGEVSAQPATLALPRLLEGTGVDYLLMADRADPGRVATLYVGNGKTAAAGAAGVVAAPAERRPTSRPLRPRRTAEPDDEPDFPQPDLQPPPVLNDEDEDAEVSTDVPNGMVPAAVPPPPVGTPGFHPVLDPFGRPMPVQPPAQPAARPN